jgi:hypothetical protein
MVRCKCKKKQFMPSGSRTHLPFAPRGLDTPGALLWRSRDAQAVGRPVIPPSPPPPHAPPPHPMVLPQPPLPPATRLSTRVRRQPQRWDGSGASLKLGQVRACVVCVCVCAAA